MTRFYSITLKSLGDMQGFIQKIPGTYKNEKPINITGTDEIHLKYDCINRSIVNAIRELILYSFALSSPLGQKIAKEPRIKHFKNINESVLSHIIFNFKDDDHKPVDFINQTISFTCHLAKIGFYIIE